MKAINKPADNKTINIKFSQVISDELSLIENGNTNNPYEFSLNFFTNFLLMA